MKNFVFTLILLFWTVLAVSQEAQPTEDITEVKVSYDYSREELGTIFVTSENSFLLKVNLFRHPEENTDILVRLWEISETSYILTAGPFRWNISSGPQGWMEFEFPYPIPIFKQRNYIISFDTYSDIKVSTERVTSTGSSNYISGERLTNIQNERSVVPKSVFINTSGRIKVSAIMNVKYEPGIIGTDQTICFNTVPNQLIQLQPPTGGSGSYTFQWQSSSNNLNWIDIPGALSQAYVPSALTENKWFRRVVTSGTFGSINSNTVLITVNPELKVGSTGPAQTICANTIPSTLGLSGNPSGGTGSYIYQWQISPDNTVWTNIPGASSASYTPSALASTAWFRLIVTSGKCGSIASSSVRILVIDALLAGSVGPAQTICYDTSPSSIVQINPPSGGSGTYTFQWQRSTDNIVWTNIPGGVHSYYSPPSLTVNTWFRRNVTSGICNSPGTPVLITVLADLIPGVIGPSQTICFNSSPVPLTLTTSPTGGTGSYTYQWQSSSNNRNWSDISGATASSFTPSPLTSNRYFRLNVTSGSCATESTAPVRISVNEDFTAGTIGSDQSICYNNAPSVLSQNSAPSGGTGTYSYQWQRSSNNSTWTNIEGATLQSYTPPALTADAWFRRNVTSGSCGTISSNVVHITVHPVLNAGTIGTNQTICYNSSPATLNQINLPSGGTGTYSFQWQRSSDNSVWTNISGATLSSYSPPALTASTWYRRNVTSGSCISSSNTILVTVHDELSAGSVGSQQSICYNTVPSSLTQTAAPSGGIGNYTFQWQSSPNNSTWSDIPGATLTTYSPPVLTSTTWYRRTVTSGECGSANSQSIRITVYSELIAGTIGSDQSICYNDVPSVLSQTSAPSGGTGTYSYQWQRSADNIVWNNITGATLPSYTPSALTADTWFRRIVTSGDCGSVYSNSVHITINPALNAGTIGTNQTICYNSSPATLNQINPPTGGPGTYSFQWQRSSDNSVWTNISGATLSSYSPPALTASTWYRRNVTSGSCISSSNTILVTVHDELSAGSVGSQQSICYNTVPSSLTQTAAPTGGIGDYTFQWQSSPNNSTWSDIPGATLTTYSPPVLTSTTWYRRTVTSGECGSANSQSIRITVYSELSPGTIGSDQSICYNDVPSVLSQVSAPSGGTGTYSYQWQRTADNIAWSNITGATSSSYTPPALTADTWFRRIVTSGDCGTVTSNSVLITVNPSLNAGTIGYAQTICYNSTPSTLNQLTSPSGGSGIYTYQWQRSTDNSTWSNISGATTSSYSPSALTVDTWFRINVTSSNCSNRTNTVLITTLEQISQAQLHDSRRINNNTSTNINVTITGGTAPYTINYTINGTPQTPLTDYQSGENFSTGILTTGTYVYTLTSVTDANGCNSQNLGTSITITVLSGEIYASNSALVLVNSSSSYYSHYSYYIKPYLDNFGIPYEECDVNSSPLPDMNGYAVLIFGHRNVYSSGYPLSQIESAIEGGVGLYSFDPHLFDYSSGFNTLISPRSTTSSQVYIPNYYHYITQMHVPDSYNGSNNYVNLRSSWTLTQYSSLNGGSDLATLGSIPLLQVSTYGNGKIAKWSGYDWVFESILGPVYGMDDLIWRGIVWAARKPFAMQGLPPMLTMRVDDVDGTGSEIENNFAWVNICNEFGIIPWLGVFVNNIPSAYIPALRNLINNHQATASPHAYGYALGYNGFIYYNHDHIYNFDAAANVREARDYFINNGLAMSNYVVPHYYEYSSACLAEVRNMGVEFIGVHWLPDLSYTPSPAWLNCGPYRINRNGTSATSDMRPAYYGDYVTLNGVEFFNCLTEIRDDGGYEWFPDNSVTSTSNRGVRHLRRAFNSMVLASLFTHEQTYIASITADNWREILRRVTTGVAGFSPEYTSIDYALRYVRAKKNLRITQVLDKSGTIEIHYSGNNDMDTKCYLFTESGGQIYSSFVGLSQVTGNNIVSVPK